MALQYLKFHLILVSIIHVSILDVVLKNRNLALHNGFRKTGWNYLSQQQHHDIGQQLFRCCFSKIASGD